MFVPVEELDKSAQRYASWADQPGREKAAVAAEETLIADVPRAVAPSVAKGNILTTGENMEKRREMLEAIAQEPADFAMERAIGKNDSVYSNFIELILEAKKKVGRIVVRSGNKNLGYATGFMVSETLLLTNWHVFKSIDMAAGSEVQFHYELDTQGRPQMPVTFQLNSNVFFHTCKELDYCFVAVQPVDVTGKISLQSIGYIFLDPALGKLGNEKEESLNIIHHPDGDYKQLSIRENLFTRITPTTIWYQSDTAQGSSGSPVFNDQWQVVALHHMGIASRNEQGEYLDKDGNVLPLIDGKIDVARICWIANEGIRISVILKDINSRYPASAYIRQLATAPGQQPFESGPVEPHSDKPVPHPDKHNHHSDQFKENDMSQPNDVQISFPASLLESNGSIQISISKGGIAPAAVPAKPVPVISKREALLSITDEQLLEVKKADLENEMDYSDCKGYQPRFLGTGFNIPLPQPQPGIRKFIARLTGTDSIVLKYYHYSLIFHSVRMMPLISAINVEGDPEKRKDESERKDVWLRDKRIPYDIQAGDAFYKKSGFDRGHMSRREDANWGNTPEDAKKFADLTCMYTNACPQINTLNQSSRRGLWGKLELAVLEAGAMLQNGRTGRISVFNGPIFKESDPVFRGIQVPLDFYKIILWLNDNKQLKATAFKLSQKDLVDNIDFEAIDIDQNVTFAAYQVSITSLEKDTKIDFSDIKDYDTFRAGNGEEELLIESEEAVKALVANHKS